MPRIVEVKGQRIEFPDSFTDAQIDAIVQRDFFAPPSVAETARQRIPAIQAAAEANPPTSVAEEWRQTGLGGLGTGVAKGVGNTAYNLGRLVHKAVGSDALDGPNEITEALQPVGAAQKTGYLTEQVGEFFVPGAATAGKLAPVANLVGKAGTLGRMGTEAASAAGVAAAQGGDPTVAGIMGAGGVGASRVAEIAAPKIMNTLLGVKPKHLETGANPGKGVLDEKVGGWAETTFLRNIKGAQERVMTKLNNLLGKFSNTQMDATASVVQPLDQAISISKNLPEQNAILTALRQQLVDEAVTVGGAPSIGQMNPQQLNAFRKHVDDIADAAKGDPKVPDAVAKTLENVKRNLNSQLAQNVPAAKTLNHQYGNLREAEKAFRQKINATEGHFWQLLKAGPYLAPIYPLMQGDPERAAKYAAMGLALRGAASPGPTGALARGAAALGRNPGAVARGTAGIIDETFAD